MSFVAKIHHDKLSKIKIRQVEKILKRRQKLKAQRTGEFQRFGITAPRAISNQTAGVKLRNVIA